MSDCGFQFLIASYHDRELDDERRRAFERHISGCPACAETLSALRALSAEIAVAGEMEGDPDAIARMHFAVDRIAGSEALNSPVARTAGLLTALAASILIIGGVWLLDLRQAESGSGTSIADQSTQTATSPEWERVAMTLRAEPRPAIGGNAIFSPRYAAAIDWMIDNLKPGAPVKKG